MAFHLVAENDKEINWEDLYSLLQSSKVSNIEFFPIVISDCHSLGISVFKNGLEYKHFNSLKKIIKDLQKSKFRIYELYNGNELSDEKDFLGLEKMLFKR